MSFALTSRRRWVATLVALMFCWLASVSSPSSLPLEASSTQVLVNVGTIDAGAMPAADASGDVSLVQDDHEAEDGLVWVGILHRATPPPSVEPRVHGAPFLREHSLAMELRPPIA